LLLTICSSLLAVGFGQVPLEGYNVDLSTWSVSGISSGACMATQMHVAYASRFAGAGMVAGVTYYCSEGSALTSLNCMDTPSGINVPSLVGSAENFARDDYNDPVADLNNDRVFVFQGTADTVVYPENGPKVQQFYNSFSSNVATEFTINAEHGFPTDFYGGPCNRQDPEYINNCGYNAAYEMLNHIYGGLTRPQPGTPTPGDFYEFDQRDFFTTTTPGYWSMADSGFVYVPSGCTSGARQCKLHIVLHGCEQGSQFLGTTFATQTGYMEVGELNDIIMLFPQAETSLDNPFGCWDWWGYMTYIPQYLFACRDSGQTLSMYRMAMQVSSQPW